MAPTPQPVITVPRPVPPTEQQATNWAVSSGKLIGVIILVIGVGLFLKWVWSSVPVRVVSAIIVALVIGYLIWGRR